MSQMMLSHCLQPHVLVHSPVSLLRWSSYPCRHPQVCPPTSLLERTCRKSCSVLACWLWPLLMNSAVPILLLRAEGWFSHPLPSPNPAHPCKHLYPDSAVAGKGSSVPNDVASWACFGSWATNPVSPQTSPFASLSCRTASSCCKPCCAHHPDEGT